jgi:hypothetical protein
VRTDPTAVFEKFTKRKKTSHIMSEKELKLKDRDNNRKQKTQYRKYKEED